MGVQSLWEILDPAARPVRLEALSRKKLAVDASIWIYQFLKAVRDKQGNSLPQSHIVGFFRRICKLLYFGILPVFVFDGGAPVLKRETINKRKNRRLDNDETRRQTARKLLAMQALKLADGTQHSSSGGEDDDNTVYLQDLHAMRESPTPENKLFLKKDDYHLPDLKEFHVSADDGRIMPEEQQNMDYDFNTVDGIDINSIDTSSKEFEQLPKATRYMILSHLRLKSRLRMGYKKDQLEELFPNSMDFSKFQIQLVQKRNFYTQKLMDVAGMNNDGTTSSRRIASDKDREYVLVKNDDGWTLSLESNSCENPIVLDANGDEIYEPMEEKKQDEAIVLEEESESDSEFEDVPLEAPESESQKQELKKIIESLYKEFAPTDLQHPKQENVNIKTSFDGLGKSEPGTVSIDLKPAKVVDSITITGNEKQHSFSEEKVVSSESIIPDEDDTKAEPALQLFKGSDFSFANSLLFSNAPKSELNPVVDKGVPSAAPENYEPLTNDIPSTKSIPLEEIADKTEKEEPSPVTEIAVSLPQEIFEPEEDPSDTNDKPEPKKTPLNLMPLWFDNTIPLKSFETPTTQPSHMSGEQKEDDDAGLIPWNEAMEMLGEDSAEESEREQFDDIQEISADQMKSKQVKKEDEDRDEINEKQPVNNTVHENKSTDVPDGHSNNRNNRVAQIIDFDFEEDEEKELVQKLIVEEEDHEKFKTQMRQTYDEVMATMHTTINDEQLLQEKLLKAKRDSDEVDQNMIQDVQELLRRFGIPYITAPMEAEAQCAELLKLGLVDGIITDDSDCFLFGGDKIYKNMFNQKQYVECYQAVEIENRLGLTQDKLIELALLLGSDYTEGIKGIGPVLAMEILAEFGTLKNFKKWYDDTISLNKPASETSELHKTLLRRIKAGKLSLPETFPSSVVKDAYVHAEVDHDETRFQWGVPSLDEIRSYLMYNVKWTQERVDEVMIPLIRDINRKKTEGTQSTIGEFFPQQYVQSTKELSLGKRMKSATNKLNKRLKKA